MALLSLKNRLLSNTGFSLLELLVSMAVAAVLANMALVLFSNTIDRTKLAAAANTDASIQTAVLSYYTDMGFYPPDVFRGWDPGFFRALPYNSDLGNDCDTNPGDCPVCDYCPADWVAQVRAHWRGPYISAWPSQTPWGGKYDYNAWTTPMNRYGCIVPAGIYVGIQGDYDNNHTIPRVAEQKMLDKNLDADNCLNGEVEMQVGPSVN